jgi:hypothetical protein
MKTTQAWHYGEWLFMTPGVLISTKIAMIWPKIVATTHPSLTGVALHAELSTQPKRVST